MPRERSEQSNIQRFAKSDDGTSSPGPPREQSQKNLRPRLQAQPGTQTVSARGRTSARRVRQSPMTSPSS
jgi:hypothetical protein